MARPHKAAAEGMAAGLPESPTAAVVDDLDIGTAALLILKRYGDDAMLERGACRPAARRRRHGRRRDVASDPERDRAAAGEGADGGGEGALT
jgi:hypothetical protein